MRDSELYRQILGLEAPWSVARVDLNVEKERVNVWVGHKRGKLWPCFRFWPLVSRDNPVFRQQPWIL